MQQRIFLISQSSPNCQHQLGHQPDKIANTMTHTLIQLPAANYAYSPHNPFMCIPIPTAFPSISLNGNINICSSSPTASQSQSKSQSPLNVLPTNNNNTSHNKYKCVECSKTFKRKTNLKIHSKIHTSEAFACPFCQKRFARKTNMKQHLRVHTGEKPFK
eukprot:346912_1